MNYGTGIDPLTGLPYASGYTNPNVGAGYGTTVVTTDTTESVDPYTGASVTTTTTTEDTTGPTYY